MCLANRKRSLVAPRSRCPRSDRLAANPLAAIQPVCRTLDRFTRYMADRPSCKGKDRSPLACHRGRGVNSTPHVWTGARHDQRDPNQWEIWTPSLRLAPLFSTVTLSR